MQIWQEIWGENRRYRRFPQAAELIAQKRVDVTINDKPPLLDYEKKSQMRQLKLWQPAMMLPRAALCSERIMRTLVNEVNKALKDMIDDGTYKKISEKWFGEDVLK